jgi:hypothetical protein
MAGSREAGRRYPRKRVSTGSAVTAELAQGRAYDADVTATVTTYRERPRAPAR